MQHEAVDGVVVRVWDKGENDRYLSVLTAAHGRILLLSKGSRSLRGEQRAISQLYTYANFEFYRRGTTCILKGGSPIQIFYGISEDLDRLNLATYLCELTCELTDEGEEAQEMLRLLLNSLYAISKGLYSLAIIKGAFELRAAAMSGYAPELDGCAFCGGGEDGELYLDVMNGALLCPDCLKKRGRSAPTAHSYDDVREADVLCPLTPAATAALRYVTAAPLSRLFSFGLSDGDDLHLFEAAAETYILSHIGHGFETLNFYHALKKPMKQPNRTKDTKGTKA
ncbi:MAG: DNA repair protein RecO [Clostridia bacterium]|nr:DNA repair protein RecO [Clostridia bacterium]